MFPFRQRSDNVIAFQRGDPRDAVGPGGQEVPGAIELVKHGRVEAPRIEAEVLEHVAEVLAMQHVQHDKGPLSGTDTPHRWPVPRPPGIGERAGVEFQALLAGEATDGRGDPGPPVDHRAEHVEQHGLNGLGGGHGVSIS